jgi:phosphatidate cytidylyltransferase
LIVIHPHAFAFEVMFFVAIGVKEMCDLAARNGVSASYPVALPCAMAVVVASSWAPAMTGPVLAAAAVFTMGSLTFMKRGPGKGPRYLDGIVTIYAFMYVGWLFSFCLQIRLLPGRVPGPFATEMDAGAAYLLMLITTTALSDVGAYAFGRLFGRRLLAPHISPGKTIEGALGGAFVSMLSGVAFGAWLGLDLVACAFYGIIVSAVAQLGDLWESLMKREAGIKDSGRALAGHGGVLDRFDSFFYAMPVGYLLTTYLLLP